MTDSKGNILCYGKRKKLKKENHGMNLEKFKIVMLKCLQKTGIPVDSDYFDIMIQPLGEYDALLYFSKVEIDSSEKILKKRLLFITENMFRKIMRKNIFLTVFLKFMRMADRIGIFYKQIKFFC